jgi:hypothetical protein
VQGRIERRFVKAADARHTCTRDQLVVAERLLENDREIVLLATETRGETAFRDRQPIRNVPLSEHEHTPDGRYPLEQRRRGGADEKIDGGAGVPLR